MHWQIKKGKEMTEIVALFTCFNRKEKTEKAIRSLVEGNPQIDFSFIVVDDRSSDGTPEMLKNMNNEGYKITCIDGTGTLFYSGGMRVAMQTLLDQDAQDYDYVLMMNDDVDFYKEAIERMVSQSQKKQDAVIVGVTCDSEGNYSYGAIKYKKGIKYVGLGIEFEDTVCDTFNANCVLIPKKWFVKSEGMDPRFIHSLGDFDFGLSLKALGAQIYPTGFYVGICEPNSKAGTWADTTLGIIERIKRKENAKGSPTSIWFYYVKKHFGTVTAVRAVITPFIKIFLGK